MAYRSPRLRWLFPLGGVAAVATLALGLWRGGVKAPDGAGVCWILTSEHASPPFERLGRTSDLDTCAATLEYERLKRGRDVTGAFQGRFVFADAEMLGSGDALHGMRWRMFFDPQRADLDSKLRARLNQERALAAVRGATADGISLAPPPAGPAPGTSASGRGSPAR